MSATWRTGHGVPADSLGSNGDYYENLDTRDVYLRSAGSYAVVANAGATLSAGALTTVENALLWLRRNRVANVDAIADDAALLTIAINSVSDAIVKHTAREFTPTDSAERTFEYLGGSMGYLDISPYELRSITSITLGGDTLVASTGAGDGDYTPLPRNMSPEGTYLYLTMRGYYRLGPAYFIYAPILNTRDVVITGDWGMAAIPPRVELACLIGVADLYRNPEQASSRGSGDFQITEAPRLPGSDSVLPPGALELLEGLERPKVG